MFAVMRVEMCWFVLSNLPLNEQCVSVCVASVRMTQRLQLSYVGGRSRVNCHLRKRKVADGCCYWLMVVVIDKKTNIWRKLQFCCAVSCELNLNLPSHFSNRFVCWPVKVEKRSGREGHGWLNVKGFSHHAPSGTENSVRCPRECQFDERKYGTKVVSLPGLATGTLRLSQLIGPITLAPWITKTVTVTV